MRIYLDNCCFNRPYDDQSQLKVSLETLAKMDIQENIKTGVYHLVWSYVLDFENQRNPNSEHRNAIREWRNLSDFIVTETEDILVCAQDLMHLGIKQYDALHVACAIAGQCACFITTDQRLINRAKGISSIQVIHPFDLIGQREEG